MEGIYKHLVCCFSGLCDESPNAMQVYVVTISGCTGAESVARWLKGFIVNEDDT